MRFRWLRMHPADLRTHLGHLKSVPTLMRPFTRVGRHHAKSVLIGVGLMGIGSSLAMYQWLPIHHLLADMLGYGLHGIGLIPFVDHGRPLWIMLFDLEDEL